MNNKKMDDVDRLRHSHGADGGGPTTKKQG